MNVFLKIAKYGAYAFVLLLGMVFIRLFLFQIYYVDGNSMLPSLKNGSVVLVYKYKFPRSSDYSQKVFIYGQMEIEKMDILLFEAPNGDLLLKRLIGMPGEFYAFRNGNILIDHQPITETYTLENSVTFPSTQATLGEMSQGSFYYLGTEGRIPPGYYLLLGDNRKVSYDSRSLGLIPEEALRGKVVYSFSSLETLNKGNQ